MRNLGNSQESPVSTSRKIYLQILDKTKRLYQILKRYSMISTILLFQYPINSYPYSLDAVVLESIANNEDIYISKQNVKIKKLSRDKAYSRSLPEISLNSDYSKNVDAYSVDINQKIFEWGKSNLEVENSDILTTIGEIELKQDIENTIVKVIEVYTDLLLCRKVYSLKKENLNFIREYIDQVNLMIKKNDIEQIYLSEMKSFLSRALIEKLAAEKKVRDAESMFSYITKMDSRISLDQLNIDTKLVWNDYQEFVNQVNRGNSELNIAKKQLARSRVKVASSKKSLLPGLSGNVRAIRNNYKNFNNKNELLFTFNIRIPLFNSGKDYIKLKESKYRTSITKYQLSIIKRALLRKSKDLWFNHKFFNEFLRMNSKEIEKAKSNALKSITLAKKNPENMLEVVRLKFNLNNLITDQEIKQREFVLNYCNIQLITGNLKSMF